MRTEGDTHIHRDTHKLTKYKLLTSTQIQSQADCIQWDRLLCEVHGGDRTEHQRNEAVKLYRHVGTSLSKDRIDNEIVRGQEILTKTGSQSLR